MTRVPGSLLALAALAALAGLPGWLVGPAAADADSVAPGPLSGEIGIGDEPELDDASLRDLVADAQRILTLRGYDAGPIDGRLGLRTQRAIRIYQDAARQQGYLEAVKGPSPEPGSAAGGRRELVHAEDPRSTAR
jgi:peptidoglycan hydrolase-like protein with peptidoglycan-binding domain